MERVTSKTLDCFVEFVSFNEAVQAVQRFETNRNGGRGGRLGQRHVEVELSRYVICEFCMLLGASRESHNEWNIVLAQRLRENTFADSSIQPRPIDEGSVP
jgi:hypothetical protein